MKTRILGLESGIKSQPSRLASAFRVAAPCAGLALTLALAASCKKEAVPDAPSHEGRALRATVESHTDGSKTHLDGASVVWDGDDRIDVRYDGGATTYIFEAENVDGGHAEFVHAGGVEALPVDFFHDGAQYSAVYPHVDGVDADNEKDDGVYNAKRGVREWSGGLPTLYLPRTQKYNAEHGGFGKDDNPMYGEGNKDGIAFRNLCGVLRLKLTGSGSVKRIVVTSRGGELLWGYGQVTTLSKGDKVLESKSLTHGTSSVELVCETPVTLTSTETTFDIVVPVGAFEYGFHVHVGDESDKGFDRTATNSGNNLVIKRSYITSLTPIPVTLEEQWVDMGDAGKWAKWNMGASSETEYGDYFGWASTETIYKGISGQVITFKPGYASFEWDPHGDSWLSHPRHCTAGSGTSTTDLKFSRYVTDATYGETADNETILWPVDDVAAQRLGGSWRMPDKSDFEALHNTTNYEWSWQTNYSGSGVNGCLVTNKTTRAQLFLPAAGYCSGSSRSNAGSVGCYWSRSVHLTTPSASYSLRFDSATVNSGGSNTRYDGRCVRPVL